ncbi:Fc.00g079340.m01.CDS01 [Cosmosporella sp. VM-42]
MTDGLIVFNAFGQEILQSHLGAYDQFIYQNERRKGLRRPFNKSEFTKFWEEWKKCKAVAAEETINPEEPTPTQDYLALPSPYDVDPGSSSVLLGDMTLMLEQLTELFKNQEFRSEFVEREQVPFKMENLMWAWFPKGLKIRRYKHKGYDEGNGGDRAVDKSAPSAKLKEADLAALAAARLNLIDPTER